MKTLTAMLTHIGIAALQIGVATYAPIANTLPPWGQVLFQVGAMFGQAWAAQVNSNSDQSGNKLPPVK